MVASKQSGHRDNQTTPRHAWLAALGLFAVARREAITAIEIAFDEAARLRKQMSGFGDDARAVARGGVITLREQVEPIIAQVEARVGPVLAPVMEKLGLPPLAVKRPTRNAKTRRTNRPSATRRAGTSKRTKARQKTT